MVFIDMSLIGNELKKILVCPLDKGVLEENTAQGSLRCTVCGRAYPVRNLIPVMLPEQKNDKGLGKMEKPGGNSDGRRR